MKINFSEIDDNSRVWVFGSKNILDSTDKIKISSSVDDFLFSWNAHGNDLISSYTIELSRFLIIALDESKFPASGCSIDALFRLVQGFERELNTDFFNRMNIFIYNDKSIQCVNVLEIKKYVQKELLFYDLTIDKKYQLETYLKPISQGWCNKYL